MEWSFLTHTYRPEKLLKLQFWLKWKKKQRESNCSRLKTVGSTRQYDMLLPSVKKTALEHFNTNHSNVGLFRHLHLWTFYSLRMSKYWRLKSVGNSCRCFTTSQTITNDVSWIIMKQTRIKFGGLMMYPKFSEMALLAAVGDLSSVKWYHYTRQICARVRLSFISRLA